MPSKPEGPAARPDKATIETLFVTKVYRADLIDPHVAAFARELELDFGGGLTLDSPWITMLPEGGFHSAHTHSIVGGTLYVWVSKGASALKLEDPRWPMMMATPPRLAKAKRESQPFVSIEPKAGTSPRWIDLRPAAQSCHHLPRQSADLGMARSAPQ